MTCSMLNPYSPPLETPVCPFATPCGQAAAAGQTCVGFDSWGFAEVQYSPSSAYLGSMTCSYLMRPGSTFSTPPRVRALWSLGKHRGDTLARYRDLVHATCGSSNPVTESGGTVGAFCSYAVANIAAPCAQTW